MNNETQHFLAKGAEGGRDLPAFRPVCPLHSFQSFPALRVKSYFKLQKMYVFFFSLVVLGNITQLFHCYHCYGLPEKLCGDWSELCQAADVLTLLL